MYYRLFVNEIGDISAYDLDFISDRVKEITDSWVYGQENGSHGWTGKPFPIFIIKKLRTGSN